MKEEKFNEIWQKYEKGKDYFAKKNLIANTDLYWDMYSGEQWKNLQSGGEIMPVDNFIKPTVKYKISTIAQNSLVAVFSDLEHRPEYQNICDLLSKLFTNAWEKSKMDTLKWKIIKSSAIQGDSYLYCGTKDMSDSQVLANTEIMFGDENSTNLQSQPYIIICERVLVTEVKKKAKENGIKQSDIDLISGDDDTQNQIGNKTEVSSDSKCLSIIYMTKDKDGYVQVARAVKECIYEPLHSLVAKRGDEVVSGATLYPIVPFVWEELPNNARGNSEVKQLMPNQIEHNKTLARRAMSVKMTAFPRIAYDATAIENPDDLDKVGSAIAMQGASGNIDQMIKYLNPASMSHDAESLQKDLLEVSMELAGAGNSALGNIDPQRVSGSAIEIIRDQAAQPLNEQISAYRQFAEDLAMLQYDMLCAYSEENGVVVRYTNDEGIDVEEIIPIDILEGFRPSVRIDISPDNAWTKYAEQQELANHLSNQHITFEEYIEVLPANSNLPVNKLKKVVERRKQNVGNEQGLHMQEMPSNVYGPNGVQSPYNAL